LLAFCGLRLLVTGVIDREILLFSQSAGHNPVSAIDSGGRLPRACSLRVCQSVRFVVSETGNINITIKNI
jgi:hypothetical protein